jgi:CIC family chloride channel protein
MGFWAAQISRLATRTTESTLPGIDRSPVQPNDAAGNRLLGLSLQFWVLLVLTGIGAGIGAGLLMKLLRAVQHFCYSYDVGTFLEAVQHAPVNRRVVVVFGAGVVASIGVFLLKEGTGGSGGKLNERIWFHSGRLAEFKTIAQSILSITIVGMGASLGRETAPKQTGAAVASWLSRRAALSSAESRLLAACGAGAGMGAVYNVPLGGALFALEVLLGTLALPLIPPALAASVIATVVSWLMLPDQPTYAVASYPVALTQLIWSLGFGPIAGLASVLYVRLIVLADGVKPKRGVALALPIVAFLALGLLAIRYPQLLGNGKDVTQLGFTGALGLPLLLALVFLKPIATAACLGCGAPGGLFTPSITFGAMLGGLLGHVWSFFWPGAMPGSYAMIGAAAVLAASMQAPIAALVLLLELTHHITVSIRRAPRCRDGRSPECGRCAGVRLPLEVREEFLEALKALGREGDGGPIVDVPDGEAAVFRLHVHGYVVQQVLVFAEHLGHAADGEDGTRRRHRSGRTVDASGPRPMPGQQFLQPRGRVIGDAREHIGEPGTGIDIVEFGGDNQ